MTMEIVSRISQREILFRLCDKFSGIPTKEDVQSVYAALLEESGRDPWDLTLSDVRVSRVLEAWRACRGGKAG